MDFLSFIPDEVRQRLFNGIVNLLSKQAEKILGDQVARAIGKLNSDAEFRDAFDKSLERAVKRFADEYEDQEIVSAVTANTRFWDLPSVRTALREVITHPSSYLRQEQDTIHRSFSDVLPNQPPERVDRAVFFFLHCLAAEVINIPQLQPLYMVQLQRASLEQSRQMVAALKQMQVEQRQAMLALLEAIAERKLLTSPGAQQPGKTLRVLIAAAWPDDPLLGSWLLGEETMSIITQAILSADREPSVHLLRNTTASLLSQSLFEGFDVLHLMAIVQGRGGLVLHDKTLSPERFRDLLTDKGLKLVVMDSCNSLTVVSALRDTRLPALIAITRTFPVPVANEFNKVFYTALARGSSVCQAFARARDGACFHPSSVLIGIERAQFSLTLYGGDFVL